MSPPIVQNISKGNRERAGYSSFKEWYMRKDNLYISRNASKYLGREVPESKWASPFIVLNRKLGDEKWVQEALQRNYERYIKSDDFLMASLHELKSQKLGCWCSSPDFCHGSILRKLYLQKFGDTENEEIQEKKLKERKRRRNDEHSEVEETEDEEEYDDDNNRKDDRKEKEYKRKRHDEEREEEDGKHEKREKHRKHK